MFRNLFKRNTYHLYESEGVGYYYVKTYKRRKVKDAAVDHIASIIPDIDISTLKITYRDEEKVEFHYLLDGTIKKCFIQLAG